MLIKLARLITGGAIYKGGGGQIKRALVSLPTPCHFPVFIRCPYKRLDVFQINPGLIL